MVPLVHQYIAGRKKGVYIAGGENVDLGGIDDRLTTHAGVAKSTVIGRPVTQWGQVGLAVIVHRMPGSLTGEEIIT
jgi:fatty-acyl-CoA synthase